MAERHEKYVHVEVIRQVALHATGQSSGVIRCANSGLIACKLLDRGLLLGPGAANFDSDAKAREVPPLAQAAGLGEAAQTKAAGCSSKGLP